MSSPLEDRPLAGRVVVVTRRPEQGRTLVEALRAQGARVVEVPAIETAPPDDPGPLDAALRDLSGFDWVAFTSATAVRAVAERLSALGLRWPAARGPRVAAVGPATAQALAQALPGVDLSLAPPSGGRGGGGAAEALGAALVAAGVADARVLLPVSDRGRPELGQVLEGAGARVTRVVAYRTLAAPGRGEAVDACLRLRPDLFLFASPSAVDGLGGDRLAGRRAVVIGPTTERAARAAGMEVVAVAEAPSDEGLLAAVLRAAGGLPA